MWYGIARHNGTGDTHMTPGLVDCSMNRVTLADVMNRDFVGVSESDDIAAAARTMRDVGEDTAVVLRGSEPVGVVTAGAALDHFVADADGETVADLMVPAPPSLRPEADVEDAAAALARSDTNALLVANGDGVLGVVTATDIATIPREPSEEERNVVVATQSETSSVTTEEVDSYSTQGICEACGGLGRNLTNVNGQLLCGECKGV